MREKEYRDYDESGNAVGYALGVTLAIFAAIMIGVAILLFSGCTTTKYVPVETVRTEYHEADTTAIYNRLYKYFEALRQRESSSDSIFDRLKETIVLKENGDTARHDRERFLYRSSFHEKELELKVQQQDSVINALTLQLASIKADSIPVPYPVEKPLTKWEQTKQNYGGYAIVLCSVIILAFTAWLAIRFRNKLI